MSHLDHEAQKIFERMRDDFNEIILLHVPPDVRPTPEEMMRAALRAIAREIAEHRLRTAST